MLVCIGTMHICISDMTYAMLNSSVRRTGLLTQTAIKSRPAALQASNFMQPGQQQSNFSTNIDTKKSLDYNIHDDFAQYVAAQQALKTQQKKASQPQYQQTQAASLDALINDIYKDVRNAEFNRFENTRGYNYFNISYDNFLKTIKNDLDDPVTTLGFLVDQKLITIRNNGYRSYIDTSQMAALNDMHTIIENLNKSLYLYPKLATLELLDNISKLKYNLVEIYKYRHDLGDLYAKYSTPEQSNEKYIAQQEEDTYQEAMEHKSSSWFSGWKW